MFSSEIYNNLIPKDHLLVKIKSIVDFSFVYTLLKDKYSSFGRESKDTAMMKKYYFWNVYIFYQMLKLLKEFRPM